MRYLVTGGCGFIGSHLVDALLKAGHDVVVLDDLSTGKRANIPATVPVLIGDVADTALVRQAMAGTDGCFHLAAIASVQQCNENWPGTNRTNLAGAIAVFDAARLGRLPVVYASSAAVYGACEQFPLNESAPTHPLSAYGADKLGCELHGFVAGHVHGVASVGLRFFNVYGPRQDPASPYSGVISIFAGRLKKGLPITIFGDGLQVRDFVHVADVVRHLMAAMRAVKPQAQVFNVATGISTSVKDLALLIAKLCGNEAKIGCADARAGDIRVSIGDPARAIAALDVAASVSLEEGLKATLDWL